MQDVDSSARSSIALTEEQFLEQQAADANAAIADTIRDLLDPRKHIRQHPWWSVGAAGLAGVAAGRGLARHHSTSEESKGPAVATTAARATLSPIIKTIISEALKFLIPTLFTGAVLSKTEEQIDQATDPPTQGTYGADS